MDRHLRHAPSGWWPASCDAKHASTPKNHLGSADKMRGRFDVFHASQHRRGPLIAAPMCLDFSITAMTESRARRARLNGPKPSHDGDEGSKTGDDLLVQGSRQLCLSALVADKADQYSRLFFFLPQWGEESIASLRLKHSIL